LQLTDISWFVLLWLKVDALLIDPFRMMLTPNKIIHLSTFTLRKLDYTCAAIKKSPCHFSPNIGMVIAWMKAARS